MKKIIEHTKNVMKNHTLRVEVDTVNFKSYLCQNGNDSHYFFRLVFLPGSIYLTGDLGEITLKHFRDSGIQWLISSCENISYLMEKTPYEHDLYHKEFHPGFAKGFLSELRKKLKEEYKNENITKKELEEKIEQINYLIEECDNIQSESVFFDRLADLDLDDYYESEDIQVLSFKERALARIAALQKFCELYEQEYMQKAG